jgi:transposase
MRQNPRREIRNLQEEYIMTPVLGPRASETAEQERSWEALRVVLPVRKTPWRKRERKGGRPQQQDRCCWEAILWRLRSGLPWRLLPARFGSPRTIQRRIDRWQSQGVLDALWSRYLERLAAAERRLWRQALSAEPGKKCGFWYWEMLGKLRALTAGLRSR